MTRKPTKKKRNTRSGPKQNKNAGPPAPAVVAQPAAVDKPEAPVNSGDAERKDNSQVPPAGKIAVDLWLTRAIAVATIVSAIVARCFAYEPASKTLHIFPKYNVD